MPLSRQPWDVLVIGAGPAGCMAARQTALRGLRTLLIERHPLPRDKVCGGCLSAEAVAWLARGGMLEAVQQTGPQPVRRMELCWASRRLEVALPEGLAVSRRAMDAALAESAVAAGATLWTEAVATVQPFAVRSAEGPAAAQRTVTVRLARGASAELQARVVIAADGLGHPSLRQLAEFRQHTAARSYVGLGTSFERADTPVPPATILMAVARHGYVGMVCGEAGRVNVAAACDPRWLASAGGPQQAFQTMLVEAGVPWAGALPASRWQGTPALTRWTDPLAAHRLLLVGDAAGYVEPFTGQGMAWALAGGMQSAPLAEAGQQAWSTSMTRSWQRERRAALRRQQLGCRLLTALLRRRRAWGAALQLAAWFPMLLPQVVQRVHAGRFSLQEGCS